ncbi:FHA domain-containing protein [Streptomyces sp. NPDC059443]|uniref:FHA domain-containing protein n=1 Tax=unclassified Streptomyces TaxID=2593676 RepID=UPI0036C75073
MTSSFEFSAYPVPRLSDAERDYALSRLAEGAALGKLSHDTLVRRIELALAARRSEELAVLTADLEQGEDGENTWSRRLFGWVGRVSAVAVGVRRAWTVEKLPKLLLPHPSAGALRIGRDPGNGLRLNHETVSRAHAELHLRDGVWVVRDLGSTNGTTVNGRRVTGWAVVRDGDQIGFGRMSFRLSAG